MANMVVLVALPFVVAFGIVAFRRPMDVLLPAYAVTVPFGSLLSTGLAPPYDSVSTPLGLLLLAALLAQLITGHSAQVRFPVTVPIWLMFLGLAGASALWSVSAQLTEKAFQNLTLLVLLYVLLALTRVRLSDLRRLETALVIGGVAASSYGIFQFLTGTLPVDTEASGGGRFGRDLLGANNTAAALLVPLAIALCRSAAGRSLGGRLANAVGAGMIMFGVLLTGSRGGLLATAGCLLVALLYVERGRAILLRYAALVVVAVAVVLVAQPGGIGARTDQTTSSGRTDIWKVGLYACHIYCLTGSGWGTFPRVYQMEQSKVSDARVLARGVAYEAHNIWILISVEAGIPGLLLALLGLLFALRDTYRLPRSLRGPPLAGFVATIMAAFFLSNFDYKFFWMTLMYPLMCRTVALTHVDPSPGEDRSPPVPPVRAATRPAPVAPSIAHAGLGT